MRNTKTIKQKTTRPSMQTNKSACADKNLILITYHNSNHVCRLMQKKHVTTYEWCNKYIFISLLNKLVDVKQLNFARKPFYWCPVKMAPLP